MSDQQAAAVPAMFDLGGRTAVVTGGGGVLAGDMARGLGRAGAQIALFDLRGEAAQARAAELQAEGIRAEGFEADCLNPESIAGALAHAIARFGDIRILVNTAGGNVKDATVAPGATIFDVPLEAMKRVVELNLLGGAVLPSQIIGRHMTEHGKPSTIINISSMSALRPLTRVVGYGTAKAAVDNFTKWLAVHFALDLKAAVRVNAIAPGFFLTEQNRFLLTTEDGALTPRGETILAHTPAGRFGEPADLVGTLLWLASDASRFVTGTVIPVDGGFSAFSGV